MPARRGPRGAERAFHRRRPACFELPAQAEQLDVDLVARRSRSSSRGAWPGKADSSLAWTAWPGARRRRWSLEGREPEHPAVGHGDPAERHQAAFRPAIQARAEHLVGGQGPRQGQRCRSRCRPAQDRGPPTPARRPRDSCMAADEPDAEQVGVRHVPAPRRLRRGHRDVERRARRGERARSSPRRRAARRDPGGERSAAAGAGAAGRRSRIRARSAQQPRPRPASAIVPVLFEQAEDKLGERRGQGLVELRRRHRSSAHTLRSATAGSGSANSDQPVRVSSSGTPNANRSVRPSTSAPRICSGAMARKVPGVCRSPVRLGCRGRSHQGEALGRPKSRILARPSE